MVTVDAENRTVELTIEGPPPVGCPGAFIPVEGLTFELADLSPGRWRIFGEDTDAAFDIEFSNPATPTGGVDWIDGSNGPDWWSLDCEDADCSGVITFQGPTDTYTNSCFGTQALEGVPVLTVDEASQSVELWFTAPAPQDCIAAVIPVTGLEGSFSFLNDGRWRLYSDVTDPPFELQFQVGDFATEGEVAFNPGQGSPTSWTLDCDDVDCSGAFNFDGPSDTYSNPCTARGFPGGDPVLSIDNSNRSVELWFVAPNPGLCTLEFNPRTSLSGLVWSAWPGYLAFLQPRGRSELQH